MIELSKITKKAEKEHISPEDYILNHYSITEIVTSFVECLMANEELIKNQGENEKFYKGLVNAPEKNEFKPITLNEEDYNKLLTFIKPKTKRNRNKN